MKDMEYGMRLFDPEYRVIATNNNSWRELGENKK
jgi:hypothetical protein